MAMETLILLLNELVQICKTINYGDFLPDLPQIIVVGAQSAGKSSVLESLVGKDFLPRGPYMVTRRPLVLELIRVNEEDIKGPTEWAEFGHNANKKYTDFGHVKQEIVDETNRGASANGISPVPILLKVFSPKLVTLTLIDLPGLVKVVADGQPADIPKQIRDLTKQYINNPNAIILAITPANTDLATSDALEIAKECDPSGNRTLAVLTKLDAVSNADRKSIENVLNGKVLKVKLGIIGVINRSQDDVDANISIEEKKAQELNYIKDTYPRLAHRLGTEFLAKGLSQLLSQYVLKCVPGIEENLIDCYKKNEAVLAACALPSHQPDKLKTVLDAVQRFTKELDDILEGKAPIRQTIALVGGSKIRRLFYTSYPASLSSAVKPSLSSEEIEIIVENCMGFRPHEFTPQTAFEAVAAYYVQPIRDCSLKLADDIRTELDIIIDDIHTRVLDTLPLYPNLPRRIREETKAIVYTHLNETKKAIEEYVDCELKLINTKHLDYTNYCDAETDKTLNGDISHDLDEQDDQQNDPLSKIVSQAIPIANALAPPIAPVSNLIGQIVQAGSSPRPNHRELDQAQKDKRTIAINTRAYAKIVRKTAEDMVPKKIVTHLITKTTESLEWHLREKLIQSGVVDELMKESPEIIGKRRDAEKQRQAYEGAIVILNKIRKNCSPEYLDQDMQNLGIANGGVSDENYS